MAGVAKGNPANVSIDSHGYVHLRIVKRDGVYTAAEMFSTDLMGYGTYQWWIQGKSTIWTRPLCSAFFPYGPVRHIGKDAEDELDIEFSKWNNTLCKGACNADFTFYPATGQIALGPTERDFEINLKGGTLTTARLVWTPTSVTGTIMSGLQPIGTTANVLKDVDLHAHRSQGTYSAATHAHRHESLVLQGPSHQRSGSRPARLSIRPAVNRCQPSCKSASCVPRISSRG